MDLYLRNNVYLENFAPLSATKYELLCCIGIYYCSLLSSREFDKECMHWVYLQIYMWAIRRCKHVANAANAGFNLINIERERLICMYFYYMSVNFCGRFITAEELHIPNLHPSNIFEPLLLDSHWGKSKSRNEFSHSTFGEYEKNWISVLCDRHEYHSNVHRTNVGSPLCSV